MYEASDMVQPNGMLTPGLFPQFDDEDDFDTFLGALLTEGYARADTAVAGTTDDQKDAIALAWAYHRAYEAIWQRLSATPAQASIAGEADRAYLASQIQTFEKLGNRYLADYNRLNPAPVTTSAAKPGVITAVPIKYGW